MLALLLAIGIASATDLPVYTPDPNAPRSDIPDVYKWDLAPLFANDDAWTTEYEQVQGQIARIESYKGTLSEPRSLLECLDTYYQVHDAANRLSLYANLRLTTATTDPKASDMSQRGQALIKDLSTRSAFIRAEVLDISDKSLAKAYKKAPGLDTYRVAIGQLRRRRAHLRSPETEAVLAMFDDNLWATIDLNELEAAPEKAFKAMVNDMQLPVIQDAEGNDVQLNLSNYSTFRRSPDRAVRKAAVDGVFGTLRSYQHVFAATLGGQYALDVNFARAHGYDTALDAYLDKDDIDPAVYKNIVQTIGSHTEPLQRYVSLRKKVLGVDKVHFYDMYIPLVQGVDKTVSFDEARTTVQAALAPLGEDYLKVLDMGMDPTNGWIDVYPHADKDSGAFSAATFGVHPYVMLNFQDAGYDMSTLAHEYGHALHSYLAMQNQPQPQWAYATFIAETASTANEALLLDYQIAHAQSEDERIYLLNERLESIKGTIYRQAQFSEFEWKVHQMVEEGTPITADLLDQTYRELLARYYGPDYEIGPDDGMEWAYIGHFYYKYYLYTYASGLSSGIAFSRHIRDGGTEAQQAYLDMLRSGSSAPPLELMKRAGVDMSTPEPIEAALKLFDETLAELEVLLDARMIKQKAAEEAAE